MSRIIALFVALFGAAAWALLAVTPPSPLPVSAAPTLFSADRAFVDLQAIAAGPHVAGSIESRPVHSYLAERLRELGANVETQPVPWPDKSAKRIARWIGDRPISAQGENLIGIIRGRDPALPAVLLMAHTDTVGGSPGASDDAMGVASVLEVARAIGARGTPARDVVLLLTDGEESGLDGATAFFGRHPLASRVGVVINLESRGGGGRAHMFETGPGNGAMMRLYADSVTRPAANSLAVLIYRTMPNSSDLTIAIKRGIAGFNFAMLDRASLYHSPTATPAAIDRASLQDMGGQALDLAAALAFAPSLPPKDADSVFSDVLGWATIAYPAVFGWVPLVLAAMLIGFAIRRDRSLLKDAGGGAIVTMTMLLHAALLLTVLNAGSVGWPINYYDRLAALPRLGVIALLGIVLIVPCLPLLYRREPRLAACIPALAMLGPGILTGVFLPTIAALAIAAMAAALCLPRERRTASDATIGALLLLSVVTIVLQIALPTAAYLFCWPLLLAAIALAGRTLLPERAGIVVTVIAAAIGLGQLAAFAYFTFLAVGPTMAAAMIVFLLAGAPLLWPLLPERPTPRLSAILLLIAFVIALWVRFDPMAPSVPGYSLVEGGAKTRE